MKKKYIKPAMEVLSYDAQAALLAGSGDSYWVPPDEPEEGCESRLRTAVAGETINEKRQ